jgi:adenosylmethionine-8-amino-7-oxononanoate aminotransferase
MLEFRIRRDREDMAVSSKATHNLSLKEMDRQSLIHLFTNLKDHASGASAGPSTIESGHGMRVRDRHGTEFIDAFAGLSAPARRHGCNGGAGV